MTSSRFSSARAPTEPLSLSSAKTGEDAPAGTDILYHLRSRFDLKTVELVGNIPLQKHVLETLPEQVEVVVDPHLRPYYGDEDETDALHHSEAKPEPPRSTPTRHCTLA